MNILTLKGGESLDARTYVRGAYKTRVVTDRQPVRVHGVASCVHVDWLSAKQLRQRHSSISLPTRAQPTVCPSHRQSSHDVIQRPLSEAPLIKRPDRSNAVAGYRYNVPPYTNNSLPSSEQPIQSFHRIHAVDAEITSTRLTHSAGRMPTRPQSPATNHSPLSVGRCI